MNNNTDRRSFVKNSSLAIAGSVLAGPSILKAKDLKADPVRIGFIGTGGRGRTHVNNILDLEGVTCPAICDIDPKAVELTREIFKNKNLSQPKVYSSHEYSFRDMLEKEKLDGVVISTNWTWHTPMCLDAMRANVYVGVEVAGAFSVDECWDLINTHQQTGTHLMILENVCYRRDVMAVLNMVRDNLFGELIHLRGGYLHDLRKVKFNDGKGGLAYGEDSVGEARWRTEHSVHRNGDLYPTHGLGPVGVMLDQNRGNRLATISSVATKSRSLKNYVRKHPGGGEGHEYYKVNWRLGDVVTSTITMARGETIILTHDTNLPRPYSLGFRVQGVEGLIDFDYGTKRIYVEGQSPSHRWDDAEDWLKKYDHDLWGKYESKAVGAGHGGMDFFLDRAFVESVRRKEPPVLDVYDAAVWRSITPLSERSIQQQGMPQHIPDFTEGRWIKRKPVFGLGDI